MYAVTFFILALLCGMGAAQAESAWAKAAFVYPAWSLILVGGVYLLRRPAWLLKAPSGAMRPLGWLLYGPFFAVNGLLFFATRKLSRELATALIVPGLFLGRLLTRLEASLVAPQPVAVVDLTAEFSETPLFRKIPGYVLIPVLDATAPSLEQLHKAAEHLREWLPQGRVYVHCALGHGRSATVIAAFLLAAGLARSVEEAVAFIREKRSGIDLNREQVKALREFERILSPIGG